MKSNDQLVKKAEEIRKREHRLKSSFRLKTQSEIVGFIHDRGLVSALGGNELPSLISAVMGKILSALERKLLETVEGEGPIRTDQLRKQLKLEAKENNYKFHRSLTNLESHALIVGAEDPHPEKHLHANIWQTWEKRTHGHVGHVRLSYQESVTKLLGESINACVLTREDQIEKWFEW